MTGSDPYYLIAEGGSVDTSKWDVAPHLAFVKLAVDDPIEVRKFMLKYGAWYSAETEGDRTKVTQAELAKKQSLLRMAWQRVDPKKADESEQAFEIRRKQEAGQKQDARQEIAHQGTNGFSAPVLMTGFGGKTKGGARKADPYVLMTAGSLWAVICVLSMRTFWATRNGYCVNPNCPNGRYFLRLRKNQQVCGARECVSYAQTEYTMKWWKSAGKPQYRGQKPRRDSKKGGSK